MVGLNEKAEAIASQNTEDFALSELYIPTPEQLIKLHVDDSET